MSGPTGGYNPAFGRDPGPPPPSAAPGGPPAPDDNGPPPPGTTRTAMPPPGYFPVPGMPGTYYYHPYLPPPPPYMQAPPQVAMPPVGLAAVAAAAAAQPVLGPPALGTALAVDALGQMYQYISGLNGSGRFPQPAPPIDPDFPAANLINSTGGAGAEPGYNYFFPTQHANVIVLKSAVPPWKLTPGTYAEIPFHAAKVPANITMAELLVGFGANNPVKGKNQLWEVYPQGGGSWGWKEHCKGDDPVMMARTVRDMGWVEKTDGVQQTVFLWISKS